MLLSTSIDSSQSLCSPESSSPRLRWLDSSLSLRQARFTSCLRSCSCSMPSELPPLSSHSISAWSDRGGRLVEPVRELPSLPTPPMPLVRVPLSIVASAAASSSLLVCGIVWVCEIREGIGSIRKGVWFPEAYKCGEREGSGLERQGTVGFFFLECTMGFVGIFSIKFLVKAYTSII